MTLTAVVAPSLPIQRTNRAQRMFGQFLGADNLNLGCARTHEIGFTNLDLSPNVEADIVCDLDQTPLHDRGGVLPATRWDCILGSHVFEHIRKENFVALVRELHRILKPGGYLVSVTPYVSSDDAFDNPFHYQGFSEMTWQYFTPALYVKPDHAGYGDFGIDFTLDVVHTALIPYPAYKDLAPEVFTEKKESLRNVVQEIHVVLQKPKETA